MKKIITLLFCTVVFASAFAQTNHNDRDDRNRNVNPNWNSNNNQVYQKEYDRDDNRYNNTVYQNNRTSIAQRDRQIQRITSQYDYRIQQVAYDRSLSNRQKRNAIKSLQAQKAQAIN